MADLKKFQLVCSVFLARLLMVHGEDAPEVRRRMADELELLAHSRSRCDPVGDRRPQHPADG